MKVVLDSLKQGDILMSIQNGKGLIYGSIGRPSDYKFDLSEATPEEKKWLRKCIKENKFVNPD